MKKLILFLVIALSSISLFSQGNIDGYVRDEANETIVGANVLLFQNGEISYGTLTDINGYYSFPSIKEGHYEILVTQMSNKTIAEKIKVNDRERYTYSFELGSAIILQAGEVRRKRSIESVFNPDKPTVKGIKAKTLKELNLKTIDRVLENTVSTTKNKNGELSFRGSRPGTAVYYIDGLRVFGKLEIPISSISGIEVYNGGIPARFGNTSGAVIEINTKSYFDFFD